MTKPANDKVFEASIYYDGSHLPYKYIDPSTPCLVSEIVTFTHEFRCYCLDGEVKDCSIYKFPGMIYQPDHIMKHDAIDFANVVLKDDTCLLPSGVVLDVGLMETGEWAVIEANQAYASGIYHEVSVRNIVSVIIRSACLTVSNNDFQFLRRIQT